MNKQESDKEEGVIQGMGGLCVGGRAGTDPARVAVHLGNRKSKIQLFGTMDASLKTGL